MPSRLLSRKPYPPALDAISAVERISLGLERDSVALTPLERNAILAQLEDPPDGLAELRGALRR